jgi:hypothetical protein
MANFGYRLAPISKFFILAYYSVQALSRRIFWVLKHSYSYISEYML